MVAPTAGNRNWWKALWRRRKVVLGAVLLMLLALVTWPIDVGSHYPIPYGSAALSDENELLGAQLADDGQWRLPMQDSLPVRFVQALLVAEDRYFYHHPGFNPGSMVRALWVNLLAGRTKQGGSTLTQQAVRIARGNPPRTIWQKLGELAEAIRWEVWHDKDYILRWYAAHAPMGGNVVGLPAACWRHFGAMPARLTWAQAATLAVLPNAPGAIHPGRSRDRLLLKRNLLLQKLHGSGLLTKNELALAQQEPLLKAPRPFPQEAPHLLQELVNRHGKGKWFQTTLDRDVQQQLGFMLGNYQLAQQHRGVADVGLLVMRLHDGAVVAYHGNYPVQSHLDDNSGPMSSVSTSRQRPWVDMVQAQRSYGSLLKPFLYATALSDGHLLPQAWLEDIPTTFEGNYRPRNFSEQYQGVVPANIALAQSLNIPFVNLQRQVGTSRFLQVLHNLGLRSLNKGARNYGLSLVLGGGEASLFHLVQAYGHLARSQYQTQSTWPRLQSLRLLQQDSAAWRLSSRMWNGAVAQSTTKALLIADRPDMDATVRMMVQRQPVAWKTGTSWGLRDAWCIGYTADYVVGVWLGNATGEGVEGLTGIRQAAPLMFHAMDLLPPSKSPITGPMGMGRASLAQRRQVRLCEVTGYEAGPHCQNGKDNSLAAGEGDSLTWVPRGIKNTRKCNYHRALNLDQHGQFQVHLQCPGTGNWQPRNWLVVPPAIAWYYARLHPDYVAPPAFAPSCLSDAVHNISLLYPRPDMVLAASKGNIIARAYTTELETPLLWLLDGKELGSTYGEQRSTQRANRALHTMLVPVGPGLHRLSIVGGDAVEFRVVE